MILHNARLLWARRFRFGNSCGQSGRVDDVAEVRESCGKEMRCAIMLCRVRAVGGGISAEETASCSWAHHHAGMDRLSGFVPVIYRRPATPGRSSQRAGSEHTNRAGAIAGGGWRCHHRCSLHRLRTSDRTTDRRAGLPDRLPNELWKGTWASFQCRNAVNRVGLDEFDNAFRAGFPHSRFPR